MTDDVSNDRAPNARDPADRRQRAEALRALHVAPEILVLVNVWDVASARAVAAVPGCRALATASAAVAAAHGYEDGERLPRDLMIATVARICAAVDLPVTADLEAGYGDVRGTVRAAVQAGAVGANLEDGVDERVLRPLDDALRAVHDAVRAGSAEGVPLVLNARTDTHLVDGWPSGPSRLDEAVRRGRAYLEAGADCVFVPGVVDEAEIRSLVEAFGPGRLSLLGVPGLPEPVALQRLGVARVSYGPFPQRWVMAALADRARSLVTRADPSEQELADGAT